MQKNIYLIRHGETDFNKNGYFQGQGINPPLNENGLLQAKNIIKILDGIDFDAVYTSPLIRALQTAKILIENKMIPLITDERLLEVKLGVAEGKSKQYISEQLPEEYKKWRDLSNWDFAFIDGETRRQALNRFMNFINDVTENDYKCIAVVTHAGIIRTFLLSQGIYKEKISNTEIINCIYKNGKLSIVKPEEE